MFIKMIYEMFAHYVLMNVSGMEEKKILMLSKDVVHHQYPGIDTIPFFQISFNRGMVLNNTYNKIDPHDYNGNILNYALNLCFHSEKSFEHENNDELCSIFCMSYYCLMENMNRTLNKEDISKIMTLIN